MAAFAIAVFAFSLFATVVLFAMKYREVRSGRIIGYGLRSQADVGAIRLKNRLMRLRVDSERLLPIIILYMRYLVHESALGFAALARASERGAHRLADFVSHKHRFVPRETRSAFLKEVSTVQREPREQMTVPIVSSVPEVIESEPVEPALSRAQEFDSVPEVSKTAEEKPKHKRSYHRRKKTAGSNRSESDA